MKKSAFLRVMSTILVATLVFSLFALPVMAESATGLTVSVSSDDPGVAYGGTVRISVLIAENPGFLGANFDVKWDTTALELVGTETTGSAFGTVSANPQPLFGKVVVTVGDPLFGLMFPNMAEQYTGTGKAVTLIFKVKEDVLEDTTAKITLDRASYTDLSGNSVDSVTLESFDLNVAGVDHVHDPLKADSCAVEQKCNFCSEILPAPSHQYVGGTCTVCGHTLRIPGDLDSNNLVNRDDVIKLLLHVTMPNMFQIAGDADFNKDNKINRDDVIKLLLHVTMPNIFPL